MARARKRAPVCLFAGVLTPGPDEYRACLALLAREFGPPALESRPFPFDPYSGYYRAEMGSGLERRFVAFRRLVAPDRLASIKVLANRLEAAGAVGRRRRYNLDPGWLDEARVVLASAKDFSHRLYLGRGIHGEVTMLLHRGRVEPLPWTYPDYLDGRAREFFLEMRDRVLPELRAGRAGPPAGEGKDEPKNR